jgi:predicted dehydrogenase
MSANPSLSGRSRVNVAVVGLGFMGVTHLRAHLDDPQARLVAVCDARRLPVNGVLAGVSGNIKKSDDIPLGRDVRMYRTFEELLADPDVQLVDLCTPTPLHPPQVIAALKAGKHVLCEKPLAMTASDARRMAEGADRAGVRHMTAFTYRFVPAMRYLQHQVAAGAIGRPYHFRSCRLQDWGDRPLGWRQVARLAGSGELGDMLSHRIDFSRWLLGDMKRLVADTRRFLDDRQGSPSDLEDWVAILAEFRNGATGVLESSKLATGRNESWRSQDYVEINGSAGSFVFFTERWNQLQVGKPGGPGLETITIPREFWTWPGSPRDPNAGDPLVTFRYDQSFEFIDAIRNHRPCVPSFHDGARVQAIMESALTSATQSAWITLPD